MSWNGSGTFSIQYAGNPVSNGTTISSAWANGTFAEVATGITNCIAKDGQNSATADLPMGNNKHTNVANATARNHYAAFGQVQDGTAEYLTSVSGADTITASLTGLAAYAAGQAFRFIAAGTNTGAVTLNINALGSKAITKQGTTALVAGDIASGVAVDVIYDGTRFQIVNITGTVALAAATVTTLAATTLSVAGDGTVGTTTANSARTLTVANTNAGASASSGMVVTSDAGSLALSLTSTAGGGTTSILSTTTGQFSIYTTGATLLQLGTNNTPNRLTISSAGAVNVAVSLSENSTRVFSRNSANAGSAPGAQTYNAANKTFTFAHGLSDVPLWVSVWVKCTSAELGYSVGNVVYISSGIGTATDYLSVSADATNVYVSVANAIAVVNRTTPSSISALAANKWDIYVRAWY